MKTKIIEITKHKAVDLSSNAKGRGAIKLTEVVTLHLACGHKKIIRGKAQPVPKHETVCRDCDRAVVAEHFEDRNLVKQAAKGGVQ